MTESLQGNLFVEPKSSASLKLIAGIAALALTVLIFAGYFYLRKRHAKDSAASVAASMPVAEPRRSPKALIIVDEALLKGGLTTLGGSVKNTSNEPMGPLSVELELKRRTGAGIDTRLVTVQPSELEPQQEGRYSLQVKALDYGSARVTSLRAGSDATTIPYTTTQGQKRPPERLDSKTILVDRPRSKGGDFLNTPDNPARVP